MTGDENGPSSVYESALMDMLYEFLGIKPLKVKFLKKVLVVNG